MPSTLLNCRRTRIQYVPRKRLGMHYRPFRSTSTGCYLFIHLKEERHSAERYHPPNVHPFVHLREAYLTYRHPVPRTQPQWHNSGVTAQAATVAHSISYLVHWMFLLRYMITGWRFPRISKKQSNEKCRWIDPIVAKTGSQPASIPIVGQEGVRHDSKQHDVIRYSIP